MKRSHRDDGQRRHRQSGVTVVELLIVITVTAVLLALATPNLRGLLARNQLLGQANQLSGALALARSEAVSQGVVAGACISGSNDSCTDGTDFILVFVDANWDGTFDGDPLKQFQTNDQVSINADASQFFFDSAGFFVQERDRENRVAGDYSPSTIEVCDDQSLGEEQNDCRTVTIAPSGLVTIETTERS
jgi:Tfp pilus assembly protein FimT